MSSNGSLPEPSWTSLLSWVAALMGVSTGFASASSNFAFDGLRILVIGSIIETGRRVLHWMVERFEFRKSIKSCVININSAYSIAGYRVSAEFEYEEHSYGWLVNYLMTEDVWHTPRKFSIKGNRNSQRKWKLRTNVEDSQVDYVPDFGAVHFFRWKGYWLEVSRLSAGVPYMEASDRHEFEDTELCIHASIALSIYTRDKSVLFAFVEECRLKYLENTKSDITVHSHDVVSVLSSSLTTLRNTTFQDTERWTEIKTKRRRPLDSLLLDEGRIESLLADAREFLKMEDWYFQAGIPHRRGYLLYGPPGTGKTSTVYTLAGELSLEVYTLSLSASGMDDEVLAALVSYLPPKAILLIEDIDCTFPSREELDEEGRYQEYQASSHGKSEVTMSGLLNVLDGLGSEEGKLFFATTNHIDRLDPALTRPGRIDRKIEYNLASRKQAHGLFMRFFSAFNTGASFSPEGKESQNMHELADEFATSIPDNEFSMAELQGYLLNWKRDPAGAVHGVDLWVESERAAKQETEAREQLRKERAAATTKTPKNDVSNDPMTEDSGNNMDLGLNPRPGHLSPASSGDVSDADSDPGTQT
ncbi:P-loop containing nucleoside triphosphate hydrolase protein [Gautieria morchelliformis]|nr:P-loop containing nucleoside triphosphate hydrolase protein [Gautieria morchelliformis]